MAEDDLQARMSLEHPAQHHADRGGCVLDRIAQAGRTHQWGTVGLISAYVGRRHAGMLQDGWRHIFLDRHIELFGARIDRPELPVVDEFAVGEAVNHAPLKPSVTTQRSSSSGPASGSASAAAQSPQTASDAPQSLAAGR